MEVQPVRRQHTDGYHLHVAALEVARQDACLAWLDVHLVGASVDLIALLIQRDLLLVDIGHGGRRWVFCRVSEEVEL